MATTLDTTTAGTRDARADAETGHGPVGIVGVAFFSAHPARLTSFYELLLGLAFDHRRHGDGREHWVTTVDGIHLEVKATHRTDGTPTPDAVVAGGSHSSVEVSVRVDDAYAAVLHALELGARPHMPVVERSWGSVGVVLDPDGNRLGLYAPPTRDDERHATSPLTETAHGAR